MTGEQLAEEIKGVVSTAAFTLQPGRLDQLAVRIGKDCQSIYREVLRCLAHRLPKIEFDDTTAFMLYVEMQYNYRRAKRFLAFNSEELKQQLFDEMHRSEVFLTGNYMPASLPASVKGSTAQAVAAASAGEMITKEDLKST